MDKKIQAAVTLNGKDKTVALATTGVAVKEQSAVFKSGFQVRGFSESSVEQQLPVSLAEGRRVFAGCFSPSMFLQTAASAGVSEGIDLNSIP